MKGKNAPGRESGSGTLVVPIAATLAVLIATAWGAAAAGWFGVSAAAAAHAMWQGSLGGLFSGSASGARTGDRADASGSPSAETASPSVTPTPLTDEVEILELLMRQNADELPLLGGSLEAMTLREDATGYWADLYLAMLMENGVVPSDETAATDGQTNGTAEGSSKAVPTNLAEALRAALALHEDAGVRRRLADALLSEGDRPAALTEYAALLPDEEALAQVLALETDPAEICGMLLSRSMYAQAKAHAEAVLGGNSADAALRQRLNVCIALATAKSGDFEGALPLIGALPSAARKPEIVKLSEPEAADIPAWDSPSTVAWWHARCLEAAGRTDEAIALYGRLGAAGGERLGALLEKDGKTAEAADAYLSATSANARWEGARLAVQVGRTSKAIDACMKLAGENERVSDDAAYRAVVLLKRAGRSAEAAPLLAQLSAYPSWTARLGMKLEWPEMAEGTPVVPAWTVRVDRFTAAGLEDAAALELEICTRETTPSEKLGLAQWRLDSGALYESVVWASRALKEEKSVRAYRLAYPRAFSEQVAASSREFDVDPLLVWAVMRTESTYRPEVLSRSGAIGLMQIMPATGQDIASRLKTTVTDEDLKNPDINVRFGTYYTGAMLRMFEGNRDRALAAYNGGGGNVKKWLKSPLMKTAEDFPSCIRFEESREYITKVMEAWHVYKWMETDARFAAERADGGGSPVCNGTSGWRRKPGSNGMSGTMRKPSGNTLSA